MFYRNAKRGGQRFRKEFSKYVLRNLALLDVLSILPSKMVEENRKVISKLFKELDLITVKLIALVS